MQTVTVPSREIPVIEDVDICVLGGSCTGVFAAVRAARLGARVALVEKTNAFGGTATNALVNVWHSLEDTEHTTSIIAGLTPEVMGRLVSRGAAETQGVNGQCGFTFNSEELKIELDELVTASGVAFLLHAFYSDVVMEDGHITAAIVETKSGRSAIRARVFVDATGDGDVARDAGIPFSVREGLQPPTVCANIRNLRAKGMGFRALYNAHHAEYDMPEDSGWNGEIPGLDDIYLFAETHMFDLNCADARELTMAEVEGRRRVRACIDMIRKYGPPDTNPALVNLAASIGVRETRNFEAAYRLTEDDVLQGRRFDDAIANGSYRVDVHHPSGGGFIFKYLDGTTCDITREGGKQGRWRPATDENPTFYQAPYRSLVHPSCHNLIMAGRMISTDRGAFGAVRVMVNMNQTGEAAGVAAWLACRADRDVMSVATTELRGLLADGGSIML